VVRCRRGGSREDYGSYREEGRKKRGGGGVGVLGGGGGGFVGGRIRQKNANIFSTKRFFFPSRLWENARGQKKSVPRFKSRPSGEPSLEDGRRPRKTISRTPRIHKNRRGAPFTRKRLRSEDAGRSRQCVKVAGQKERLDGPQKEVKTTSFKNFQGSSTEGEASHKNLRPPLKLSKKTRTNRRGQLFEQKYEGSFPRRKLEIPRVRSL